MEMLHRILTDERLYGILLDIGLPVLHKNLKYNCRAICKSAYPLEMLLGTSAMLHCFAGVKMMNIC